jgi:hypothetical protein
LGQIGIRWGEGVRLTHNFVKPEPQHYAVLAPLTPDVNSVSDPEPDPPSLAAQIRIRIQNQETL